MMNTREYFELFRYLMGKQGLLQEDVVFVENIGDWCREQGISEPDADKPVKLVAKDGEGLSMLVRENLPEEVIEERINAMRIRGQLMNVAFDKADMLNSVQKKLAYLVLFEYAMSLPEADEDERLADDWAFREMERLGFFKT
jgi:hypothetical protein